MKNNKGLSLIELLAILLLISMIVLIITPIITKTISNSNMKKYEVSYETLLREIQEKQEVKKYIVVDGQISPNLDFSGTLEGNGTISIDEEGNAEVQIQVGKSDFCVFKTHSTSKVNVKRGACNEGMLAGFELRLIQGFTTNHSISVAAFLNGNAEEYYFQINNREWLSNETIGQNYYVFEDLNYNSTYEIKAKTMTTDNIEVLSDSYFFSTVDVPNPIITPEMRAGSPIGKIDFVKMNLEDYVYRYRIDGGEWNYVTEQITEFIPAHNNHNVTAEVLDRNTDTMTSINTILDYSVLIPMPTLTVRKIQHTNYMDKYVDINYERIDNDFTYQYYSNDDAPTETRNITESVLLTKYNTTVTARVLDKNGDIMKEQQLHVLYYDDTDYYLSIVQTVNGTLGLAKLVAKAGEPVNVIFQPEPTFTIDYYTVNTETYREDSFPMPRADAVVTPTWMLDEIEKYRFKNPVLSAWSSWSTTACSPVNNIICKTTPLYSTRSKSWSEHHVCAATNRYDGATYFICEGGCSCGCPSTYSRCWDHVASSGWNYGGWSGWTTSACSGASDVCKSTTGYSKKTLTSYTYTGWAKLTDNQCNATNHCDNVNEEYGIPCCETAICKGNSAPDGCTP